jgi:O-succinylbenzoic acid--CoA ligase
VTSRPLHAVLLPPEAAAGRLLEALSAALDGSGPAILPLDPSLPGARLAGLLDAFAPSAVETTEGTKRIASATAGRPASPGVRPDVAVVLATSGSTGQPKGAQLSAAALLASARASLGRLGAADGQRWLCCLPAFHMAGLGVLVRSLLTGVRPAVVDAGQLTAQNLAAADCGYVSLVPTQLRRLLDAGAPLAGFRAILLGGAAVPTALLADARAAGGRVITTYGMTETCGGCVYDGTPLDDVCVDIRSDGRIRIAGPVLFSGYRLRPEETEAALDGGWFISSDLGSLDASGRLTVRGRADGLINTGGEKVVAAEVEAVLASCDGVREAVVVGVPDADWGERVTAVVVPADPEQPPGLEQLRAHVRDNLPAWAAPRTLLLVAQIPLLASGKPDRAALRKLAAGQWSGQDGSGAAGPPEGARYPDGNNWPR